MSFQNRRLGCVGIPISGVSVKIVHPETFQVIASTDYTSKSDVTHSIDPTLESPEGEILLSGPCVMKGYHKNDIANEIVFVTIEGKRYLRTGDLGKLVDKNKFLKITGRLREIFKLENGKFVAPGPLEDIYARGPFVLQCLLCGMNQASTSLLVVPNYPAIYEWAKENNKSDLLELIPQELVAPSSTVSGSSVAAIALLTDFMKSVQMSSLSSTATDLAVNSHATGKEPKNKTDEIVEKFRRLFHHEDFILLITEEVIYNFLLFTRWLKFLFFLDCMSW
jgi:long-subunit acyl-CoA synthetase (AMP-forming)